MSTNRQIAVIGLGAFGMNLVKSLSHEGASVIAADDRIEKIEEVKEYTYNAVCFDATDIRQLKMHGFTEVDVAVIAIGEKFDSTVIIAMELLNAGVKEVFGRATTDVQEQILRRLGVTDVINPEKQIGERLGVGLVRKGLKDLLELGDGLSVIEFVIPSSMVGFTLKELELRKRFGVNVLTLQRLQSKPNESTEANYASLGFADPDMKLVLGDKMVVLGNKEDCSRLISIQ